MSFRFRRGDTASVTLKFNKDISDKDVRIAIFDAKRNKIYQADNLHDDTTDARNGNVVIFDIGYDVTKDMMGLYFLDILLKQESAETYSYVSSGDKPIEMFFEESLIAQTLEDDTTGNNNN